MSHSTFSITLTNLSLNLTTKSTTYIRNPNTHCLWSNKYPFQSRKFLMRLPLFTTSIGDLCHVRTSELISGANWGTVSCVMRFLPTGHSEQTMILHLSGSGKYTTVLCFSITGGVARVPAPSRTWSLHGFMEWSLMSCVITGLRCVFHFGTSEVKCISL